MGIYGCDGAMAGVVVDKLGIFEGSGSRFVLIVTSWYFWSCTSNF